MIDAQLLSYASVRQIEYLEAIEATGNMRQAAIKLNVHHTVVTRAMQALRLKAAMHGHAPTHDMTRTVPIGFKVKGISTLYNTKGEVASQWVKSTADDQAMETAMEEFAANLAEGVKGLSGITPAPEHCDDDLMCVIPIGDPHFGLRVWAQEGGDNFDLDMAEKLTCSALDRLIASAPPAKTAMLLNLGDHFPSDNHSNTTTAGTEVDVDRRRAKIPPIALRSLLYCIPTPLARHDTVHFTSHPGDHDQHRS